MMDDRAKKKESRPLIGFAGTPNGSGYEIWREEYCRQILNADLVPLADGAIKYDITPALLPRMKLASGLGTPMRFVTMGVEDHFGLVMSPDTTVHIAAGNREVHVGAGGIGINDAQIRGASVAQMTDGRIMSAVIDRKMLLNLCQNAEDRICRPVAADRGVLALLYHYYDLAVAHAPHFDALTQNVVAQHLADLTALALGAGRDAAEEAKGRGLAAARLEAIKADILTRLGDGDLTLAALAQRHRTSPRYVQMLFERSGMTFSEFVLEQRLLQAARLLRDPLHRHRKVSDIADLSGFNDVSYFHRAFRRRFGMTPSDMRATAQNRD